MRKLQLHDETTFLENDKKIYICFEKDFFLKSNDFFFSENKLEKLCFLKLGWNYKEFAFTFYH